MNGRYTAFLNTSKLRVFIFSTGIYLVRSDFGPCDRKQANYSGEKTDGQNCVRDMAGPKNITRYKLERQNFDTSYTDRDMASDAKRIRAFFSKHLPDLPSIASCIMTLSDGQLSLLDCERPLTVEGDEFFFHCIYRCRMCQNCGQVRFVTHLAEHQVFSNIKMKCCSSCKSAHYCSKACQKQDWNYDHKVCCKNICHGEYKIAHVLERVLMCYGLSKHEEKGLCLNLKNNAIHRYFRRSIANANGVLVPVFDNGNIIFIPMSESMFGKITSVQTQESVVQVRNYNIEVNRNPRVTMGIPYFPTSGGMIFLVHDTFVESRMDFQTKFEQDLSENRPGLLRMQAPALRNA